MNENITFYNHEVVQRAPDDYVEMMLSPQDILQAWRDSMFSFDLLDNDGQVKSKDKMNSDILQKYLDVTDAIKRGEDTPKPILGIGIMDNIEIGIGREIVAATAVANIPTIPIHVRKGQLDEVKAIFKK